jgi:ArsR family transcriptional regulator, arsenate/arsenite/antimonite-responsive transcriptional repressor
MKTHSFSHQEIIEISDLLKVISEPKRLLLLDQIINGVHCNCDLGKSLNMAPNLISHHLGVLRDAGLVNVDRDPGDSRWVYYSIDTTALVNLKQILERFLNSERIQPRRLSCGPQVVLDQL